MMRFKPEDERALKGCSDQHAVLNLIALTDIATNNEVTAWARGLLARVSRIRRERNEAEQRRNEIHVSGLFRRLREAMGVDPNDAGTDVFAFARDMRQRLTNQMRTIAVLQREFEYARKDARRLRQRLNEREEQPESLMRENDVSDLGIGVGIRTVCALLRDPQTIGSCVGVKNESNVTVTARRGKLNNGTHLTIWVPDDEEDI